LNSSLNRIENIWFEISKCGKRYTIGGIYRHILFTSTLEELLDKFSGQPLPSIVAGDINIDLSKCSIVIQIFLIILITY